jgi:cell wall-associated NlpC family hydrolase
MTAVFLCFSITACSHVPDSRPLKNNAVSNKETVTDRLYSQYDKWKGVEYKMGGLSKNGADCSGFVYLTYLELFDKKLPRSTRLQSQIGKEIQTDKRRSGDLVFLKPVGF